MYFYDALREIAKREKKSFTYIAQRLGKTNSYISRAITRNSDPSTANAAAMLSICGWVLCAVPVDRVPDYAMVISPRSDKEKKAAELQHLERQRDMINDKIERFMNENQEV